MLYLQRKTPCKYKIYKGFNINGAVWTGLEPATSAVTGRHSNQLNYQTVYQNEKRAVFRFGAAKVGKIIALLQAESPFFSEVGPWRGLVSCFSERLFFGVRPNGG